MNKKLLLLSVLLGAFVMFAPACGDDNDTTTCVDADCVNGACFSGSCLCDDGFVQDVNEKCTVTFDGNYTATENCTQGAYTVPLELTGNEIRVTNFWDAFAGKVVMKVNGKNITIDRQEPDNDDFFVQGSGSYTVSSAGKVTVNLTYTVRDESVTPNDVTSCTATYKN
jgi:hypothetical protein